MMDKIVEDMVNGLEKPTPEIMDGKKCMVLRGDFVTIEAEPVHGDRAFIVNGEEDEPTYWVEITKVTIWEN